MQSLTDLRLLVLRGSPSGRFAASDIDLLNRRATVHVLLLARRVSAVTLLRVVKRLAMRQDDMLVLYDAPRLPGLLIALAGRFARRPVLGVASGAPGRAARTGTREISLGAASTQGAREDLLLRSVARLAGRPVAAGRRRPLRLDIGCGSQARPGFVGIDARPTRATAIVADARMIPVGSRLADEIYASCLLEHFDDPHEVLREIHRVLRPGGQALLRLPNLGTYSSHLDTTHRFLADLALWRRILGGYFGEVRVVPVGTKYRDNPWLVRINWLLVNVLGWYELAQGWDFVCRKPRAEPSIEYTGWWEE